MTIEEKNEQIEAISKMQNQYFLDKDLSDEQKNARGTITFLEQNNINYDWTIYCLLTSESYQNGEECIATKVKETYNEKIERIEKSLSKILNISIEDLHFSKVEMVDGKLYRTSKEEQEIRKIQVQVFDKIKQMHKDNILDKRTFGFLLSSALEYYNFYENQFEIPLNQYEMMGKSK